MNATVNHHQFNSKAQHQIHQFNLEIFQILRKTDESVTTQSQPLLTSRLLDEFEYMNVILGQGGHGSVAKFRNKKDDQIYAIKKTKATQRNEREVKVLSNLHHENIVRYYNCWTEPNDSAFPKRYF